MGYDTTGFNSVPELQSFLGVKPDGVWGPISQKAYNKNLGRVAGVGKGVTQSAFTPQSTTADTPTPIVEPVLVKSASGVPVQSMFAGVEGTGWNKIKSQFPLLGNQEGLVGTNYMHTNADGTQGTLDLSGINSEYMTPEVIDAIKNPTLGEDAGISAFSMPSMADFGSVLGGVAQIGSYFNARDTNKENKRMNDAKLSEFARLKDKDETFSKNMNASGLGTRA